MKFMVTWRLHPEKRVEVMKMWSGMTAAERADVGEGVTMLGRWHNPAAYTGVLVVETTDAEALFRYLGRWNPAMDLEVSPVLNDEESAAAGLKIIADLGV